MTTPPPDDVQATDRAPRPADATDTDGGDRTTHAEPQAGHERRPTGFQGAGGDGTADGDGQASLDHPPTGARDTAAGEAGVGVLLLVCTVQFMVVLDATIANVALPAIGTDLSMTPADLQYVVTLYAATFGGLLLLAGRAGDLLGRRRLFVTGTAVFSAASAACGLSPTSGVLLAARVAQGLGAALISATALALLLIAFAEGARRDRALGVWSGMGATGAGAGLVLGGVLTDTLGWPAVFLVNVPLGVIAIAASRILPADRPSRRADAPPATETRADAPGRPGALAAPTGDASGARTPAGNGTRRLSRATRAGVDVPGAVTATLGIGSLIYGVTEAQRSGPSSASAASSLAVSAVLLTSFVLIQRRSPVPMIPPRLLAHRTIASGNLATLCIAGVCSAQNFFLMLYMMGVLNYSPLQTGLAVAPTSVMALAGGILAPRLTARMPARFVAATGLALACLGEVMLIRIGADSTYLADLLPGLLVFGLGLGPAFVGCSILATTGGRPGEQGVLSGILNTFQQVGVAVGVAAMVAGATAWTAAHTGAGPVAALVEGYAFGLLLTAVVAAAGALFVLTLGRPSRNATGSQ
ncbi:MFS transporter [Sphaerisporangium sp. TRM90804]|uniref:MFS transporter n=1 Tax=Sphaerisporangium sp. TRM90804 TaxID=3031113 RepID=UPI0024497DD0|nr:MFS transporter [Sphaerisporangium sp. TRM90804]MDH2427558.1 MFS transporter [Sphaerisporangium sp. TRM90804]